ncbi:metallophosphoesterase family protein [Methylogaea oryzae]|uniref:Calcineurin-like phosphoesterase domain-containing protein n=1 Tax=Methylogaea oryzae TaxID=1295382 RepID=A0A8D4VPA8_9GAMM|nr:metallophosphoesterase [Methylogaea oryzae]BBL71286.1 hypothetical protein MoryE10_18920 [Methylogaea oryzae]
MPMPPLKRRTAVFLACIAALCCGGGETVAQSRETAAEPVALSFVFFGCNRLDKDGAEATDSKSTANVAQLLQSFQDIARLPRLPQYVFLAGDIVKAKKPGTDALAKQLSAWVKLATNPKKNPLIGKGVPLVAFTGNHELLVNQDDGDCKYAQCPNPPAYAYWPQFMESNPAHYDFIAGDNGPKQGGPDGLLGDESRLSYSLLSGDTLFVVLNTDSRIDRDTIGDVPLDWLKQQLQAAQRDSAVRHVFVMGHKPLQSSDKGGDPGDRTIRPDEAGAFYALLNDPAGDGSPSKVRAYLAAHAHEWSHTAELTVGGVSGKIPQIVAGNGGSPPNSAWQGKDAYFGYTLVEIGGDGTITAKSYGRPIQAPYYQQNTSPATLRAVYTLGTQAATAP